MLEGNDLRHERAPREAPIRVDYPVTFPTQIFKDIIDFGVNLDITYISALHNYRLSSAAWTIKMPRRSGAWLHDSQFEFHDFLGCWMTNIAASIASRTLLDLPTTFRHPVA